jgi:hypothetical protein
MDSLPGVPLAIGAVVALTMLFGVVLPQLGPTARLRRRMRRKPIRSISDVRSNEVVRVRGTVRALENSLVLPFVDRAGVFHVTYVIDSSNPGNTTTFVRKAKCEILLEDGTGRARIARETPVELIAEEHSGGIGRNEPALTAVLGADVERIFSKGGSVLWRQRSIAVGDEVLVWGRVILEPDPTAAGANYRSEPTRAAFVPIKRGGTVIVEISSRRA